MEEPPVIGEFRVEVLADTASSPQFIQRYLFDGGYKFGVEDLVDAPAMLIQGLPFRSVTSECSEGTSNANAPSRTRRGWGKG